MRLSIAFIVLSYGFAGTLKAQQEARTQTFALVIGSNRALSDAVPRLRFADDDAVTMSNLLVEAGVSTRLLVQLDPDTRELNPTLKAPRPTAAELERAVVQLAADIQRARLAGKRTELVIFYSGHGDVAAGEGYVTLEDDRLRRAQLYRILQRTGADTNHVMVDACMSSSLLSPRGAGGRRRPYTGSQPLGSLAFNVDNTGFVLSTSSARQSHEWDRYQAGVFSHQLRSALRGAADADHDAVVSYVELAAFLARANAAVVPQFRPDVLVRAPRHDTRSAVLRWRTPHALDIAPGDWGHLYVETPHGERVLDVHPAEEHRVRLWLPNMRPLFVRSDDGSAEYVVDAKGPFQLAEAAAQSPSITQKGALSLAFENIFRPTFSYADVVVFDQLIAMSTATEAIEAIPAPPLNVGVAADSGGRSATWWVAGGSALALAAGVVCGAISRAEFDRVERLVQSCPSCTRARIVDEQETGKALESSANILFGAAGAAAITAGLLYFLEPNLLSTAEPMPVTPTLGGLELGGRF